MSEHFLERKKPLAALTLSSVGLAGLSMIDAYPIVGVVLCCIGGFLILWLYLSEVTSMPTVELKKWPIFAILLISMHVILPAYFIVAKAKDVGGSNERDEKNKNCSAIVGGNNYGQINQNCSTKIFEPPRKLTDLYQNNEKVGVVGGVKVDVSGTKINIENIRIDPSADLNSFMELQNAKILCPELIKRPEYHRETNTFIGVQTCNIIGLRSSP